MSLYDIELEIQKTYESAVDSETGEINEELYAKLDELYMERESKIENIACWIKDLRAESLKYKTEAKSFIDRAKAEDSKADRLESYLAHVLAGEKFKTTKCEISWRKSTTVECDDMSIVPFEFLRYKDPELNKTDIKKALSSGKDVPGCRLAENNNMSIK